METVAEVVADSTPAEDTAKICAYCGSPVSDPSDPAAKELIGKTLPSLEERMLLRLVYGGFEKRDGGFAYNAGPGMFDESDTVWVRVAEQLGNDTLKLVYLRGTLAITDVMHNFFQETCLMLRRTHEGWLVLDAYVDVETIDFSAVSIAGTCNGRLLLKYETSGVYSGGVHFAGEEYRLLHPAKLQGPSIDFMVGSSNTGSLQCMKDPDVPEMQCDCYNLTGEVAISTRDDWDCLVLHYEYVAESGDCELENAESTKAEQVWYMNADTAFQASGAILSEWASSVTGKVVLQETEIKRRLGLK